MAVSSYTREHSVNAKLSTKRSSGYSRIRESGRPSSRGTCNHADCTPSSDHQKGSTGSPRRTMPPFAILQLRPDRLYNGK